MGKLRNCGRKTLSREIEKKTLNRRSRWTMQMSPGRYSRWSDSFCRRRKRKLTKSLFLLKRFLFFILGGIFNFPLNIWLVVLNWGIGMMFLHINSITWWRLCDYIASSIDDLVCLPTLIVKSSLCVINNWLIDNSSCIDLGFVVKVDIFIWWCSIIVHWICLSILIWRTQNYVINHWYIDNFKSNSSGYCHKNWCICMILSFFIFFSLCVCNSIILQLMIWFIYQSWSLRTQCCIINHISSIISGWNFGVIYLIFKLNFSFCYLHLVLSLSRYHIVQKWSYKLFLDGIWMNIWHVCYSHL